ncbi:uncharacterized protein [Coffea arabica]|uniref:Uncharacterized protein n=1 Tax=Coffea arabica TaxID=13443 RepID=A0A6P6U8J3_COFAR|nr:uncharacterized protein LOC113708022 [Coffea arabica]
MAKERQEQKSTLETSRVSEEAVQVQDEANEINPKIAVYEDKDIKWQGRGTGAKNHMGQVKTAWAMSNRGTSIPILDLVETIRLVLIKAREEHWTEFKVHIPQKAAFILVDVQENQRQSIGKSDG